MTVANIRLVTGLTTTEISDADLTSIITLAEGQIAAEPNTSLTSGLSELASTYLSAMMALKNVSNAMLSSGGDYALGPLRVNKSSGVALRQKQANSFLQMYNEIIALGGDGSAIRKIESL